MVVLMGGRNSVGFRQFTELTVKAFLACRPYGQAVVDTASLMSAAEFPSYKGEGTMIRLKERFRLDLSEREAAEYMMSVVINACENKRSIVYDEFQRITNGPLLSFDWRARCHPDSVLTSRRNSLRFVGEGGFLVMKGIGMKTLSGISLVQSLTKS